MHLIEWIAALVALGGAWCIGSSRQDVRQLGFCAFLLSNALWIVWGGFSGAWGLVTMQALFCVTSVRGIITNRSKTR